MTTNTERDSVTARIDALLELAPVAGDSAETRLIKRAKLTPWHGDPDYIAQAFEVLREARAYIESTRAPEMVCDCGHSESAHDVGSDAPCGQCSCINPVYSAPTNAKGRLSDAMIEAIQGMSVSVDVSTSEETAGHRYFGTVCVIQEDPHDKHGVTLLVQDAEPNFPAPQPSVSAAEGDGLALAQEPKYTVRGGRIVNRASGEAIPDDEPVFILRARDVLAIDALVAYSVIVGADAQRLYTDPAKREAYLKMADHHAAVDCRIGDFSKFKKQHPERMKKPDTAARQEPKP